MGRKKRLVSSTLVRVIIVFASVIACTPDSRGTGSPAALKATVFGRFDPPSGSVFIGDSSSPHSGQFGTNCPSYTRIFGTTDLVSFEQAIDATAQKAQWSDAQSQTAELPPHARALAPLDGVSARPGDGVRAGSVTARAAGVSDRGGGGGPVRPQTVAATVSAPSAVWR